MLTLARPCNATCIAFHSPDEVLPVPGRKGFFTSKSDGIHNFFSTNDTFTTDAGPVCVPAGPSSAQTGQFRIIGQR